VSEFVGGTGSDSHQGPDALSRRQPTEEEIEEGEKDADEADQWLKDILLFSHVHPLHYDSVTLPSFSSNDTSQDTTLRRILHFLETTQLPAFPSNTAHKHFIRRSLQFFIQSGQLFKRCGPQPPVKVIFDPDLRAQILNQAHEELGHCGIYGVFQAIRQWFYWLQMYQDVTHHVRSCHECQICSTRKAEVPLIVSPSPRLFMKIYVNVMLMPKAHGYCYLVAARDDLSLAAEGHALRHANAESLAKFFWEEIICRYGVIAQIVTDNGSEVKGAFEKLMQRYSIPHICISPYNSKANGVVEQGHFIIHEAIIKSCDGDINLWPTKARGVAAFRLIPYYACHLPSSPTTTMENSDEESSDNEEIQYDSDDSQ